MDSQKNVMALKALLVAIQLPKVSDDELRGSLAELARLVTTLGYQVVGQTSQRRNSEKGANVVGDGKLQELAQWTGGTGVVASMVVKKKHKAALKFGTIETIENNEEENLDEEESLDGEFPLNETEVEETFEDNEDKNCLTTTTTTTTTTTNNNNNNNNNNFKALHDNSDDKVREKAQIIIFDCDLSPSQLRNVESATGVTVLDRTGVIIEIFSRHARTRAAKLQVEIARLTYVAPRLRETGGSEDQQGGGGKGAGETSLELDRRKIRDRIKELKENLAAIAQEQDHRRARREQEISVALVGYTNAGKSSLMRALTGSEVLVANQLFATLDTTVRALYPESHPRILISDTVGFIKKLPHDLVASFKSTLDEALSASLLLYVVDSSDSTFRSQLAVTKKVLAEVGAENIQSLLLLNKVDCLAVDELQSLKTEYPDAVFLSSKNPSDVAALRLRLISYFETDMIDQDILIPYLVQGAIGEIRSKMRVLAESYDGEGVTLKVRGDEDLIKKIINKYDLK
jgi:GTP-binding protein HflX